MNSVGAATLLEFLMTSAMQLDSWKPRSYQRQGVKIMISQACAGLLMDPGLGKTSCTYMAVSVLKAQEFVKRVLVICPLRPAYRVWPHQKDRYTEFTHLKVGLLHGKDKEATLADPSNDICVINPEGLPWLFGAQVEKNKLVLDPKRVAFIKKHFDMLVVDESTKFKNPQTQRFKLLRNFIKFFKRRYILTGTPTPKGLMDLFGQMYILDEGQSLGRYITHYRNEYFYPSGYGGYDWTPQPDAAQRIGEKIAPLVLRVGAKGNIELPEIVFDDVFIDLPPSARRQYDAMELALMAEVEAGRVVASNAAVASGKCRQIANGHVFGNDGSFSLVHEEKYDALNDLVEQLQGEPLLVTYEFKPDALYLQKKYGFPSISTGNIKADDKNIQLFSKGKLPVVIGQPQSISLGTDGLQDNCFHVAMVGCTWNLQDYIQVIDRVRRSGNKSKHVVLHRILARDTIDERVLDVLDGRGKTQASFMELLRKLRS